MGWLRTRSWKLVVLLCSLALLSACKEEPTPLQATASTPGEARLRSSAATNAGPRPRTRIVETGTMPIDRIYHSMQGPFHRVFMDTSDLDWVTSIRTEVIDLETNQPMGDEFFCHSQVQLLNGTRLLTMATGADELRFPKGFAMPLTEILAQLPRTNRALTFLGMALNNHEADINRQAKVRATVEYFKDSDFKAAARPRKLFMSSLIMQVEDLDEYAPPEDEPPISDDVTTHCALVEQPLGGKLSLHWMVPPGTQKTRKRFQGFIPIDGRMHFAWAHLHNYGVYMRLTDVTAGEVVFQANVENEPDRAQIAKISHYSSPVGFPLYADHEYEIEALYNNTTEEDVDAMAMMALYYGLARDDVTLKYTGE